MNKITKTIIAILLIVTLLQHSVVLANVVKVGEAKYIERGGLGFYSIQYKNPADNKWYYITYSRTYYTDDNGEKRIAYCNCPNLNGVGWLPGEYDGYDTTIKGKISDNKLWRVFKNGYPYVSPETLGVETEDDAYLATKQSAYFVINGRTKGEVYDYFRAGLDPINDQEMNETYRRGVKVVDAIYRLVETAYENNETINDIDIEKVGDISADENNINYSYQEYNVANNNDATIEITGIENAPQGTYIENINGEKKSYYRSGEHFKIVIPNENVDKDYDIKIEYKVIAKNYPIFLAKSSIENTQDYLLSAERYDDEYKEIVLHINSKKAGLEITKIDEETKEAISNVTFNIKYKNGQNIGDFKTDKNGKIILCDLLPENIIVTEIDAPEKYILNSTPREYSLCYNKTISVEFDNKEAEPSIDISKEGPENASPGEEIKYNFNISNKGNVGLENFTWYDFLPYDKAKITKISTGTFNQDLEYNVYYRTDKNNEYVLLKENLKTTSNNFLDLSSIELEPEENIIEIKFEFGNVDTGFKSNESPYFYLKIKQNVEDESIITNKTKLQGSYKSSSLISEDSAKTVVKHTKTEFVKSLPRTGF